MNAIELSLFSSRINAVCEQMGAVLQQTAFSPNIRDRLDYSCAIFDADGQLCAQAAHIPVHLGSMAYAMRDIVNQRNWQEGDTVILNDPFMGGTHLPDVTIISPVFHNETLHAFVANRAHHADIGSDTPGSMPISSHIKQEGLVISPTLIGQHGKLINEALDTIISQLRSPEMAKADFMAQIGVNKIGIERLQQLIKQCTDESFSTYLYELNNYARRIASKHLSMIPDGIYAFSDLMDDDGQGQTNIPITCTITINQDRINVDFSNTAEQVNGNINCPLSVTAASVYYCFRCLMPDYIPNCAGAFDLITLSVPNNCLLNAHYPAAVAAGNVETSTRVVDVVLGALAKAVPEQIPAASYGSMNNIAMGTEDWSYYETLGGGFGASVDTPGISAKQAHMTNTLNTPIEILESHFPLRIKEYSIRQQSGGNGKQNGGDGLLRHYEFLQPTSVSLLTERRSHSPWGIQGGQDGKNGQNLLNSKELPAKTSFTAKLGDSLIVKTPGGGGYGHSGN